VEFAAHAALSNTKEGSKRNIEYHYDAGNSFYELFLDKTMLYSSGIHGPYLNGEACTVGTALSKIDVNDFQKREEHLEQAQYAKIDAMIDRLGLPLTDPVSVLEIGCGWGALAIRLCQRFPNANVTGLTLSNEQHAEATKRVARAGLTNQIEIVIRDYRDVSDVYDAVISIEMLEAVGHEHLPSYFGTVSKALKLGGVCAIQVITMPNARYKSYCQSESDFIRAYIFPGGHLPSIGAMEGAANCVGLKLDSYLDIGNHYAVTLRLWRERMMANAPKITGELGYSEKFLRMFEFYFAYCEAGFARGLINDLQMTWVKHEGGSGGIDRKHQSTRLTDAIEKSARNSRRVSIAALSGYVFWILNEDVSRNFQPHVFGIVKGTAAIVLVHFFVTVCAAGATAATGGKAGKAGKGLNLKSSVQTASPVAALVIATTVAFLVTRSVFELGCDEKTFNLLFVNGRWVNSVGGSIRTVAKAVLECVLTVETPVTEYASASLVAVASASAAVTRLLAAAVGADASSSGSSTPGVTRSERDQKRSFVARVVDSLVLFACVLALRQGMGLNAVLVFSLAWIARVGANVSEIAKKSSGYPSRDPRRLLRTVFAFAAGAGFVVARVVPHLFLMTATAMNGYWVVRDVATAAAQSLLYAFESGNFDARAVSIAVFQNASSAVSASGALSACVAVSATGALILDFGAVSHSTRLRTAEKAVRERIIRLSTSADV
jgi:cyclopropane fatty-acyl-phospholipid synthase-like methyltransferase